jgi:2-polyprenyl-3-methyl-5-hydroxy-6-metoxy-1,4-benzoquinol methylase
MAALAEQRNPAPACWACGGDTQYSEAYLSARLVRCQDCGFLFQPARTLADVRELYGDDYFKRFPTGAGGRCEVYSSREESRSYEAEVRVRLVEKYVPSGRLLEIGAAAGHFLGAARRANFSVLGIEPSEAVASEAGQRFGVEILTGFVEEIELPRKAFDVACAWHVLEHLAEPLTTLSRLRDALAPAGHLVLEVPNVESVRARRETTEWGPLDLEHHVGHYGPRSLGALLQRAGFEIVTTYTVPPAVYRRPLRRLLSYGKQIVVLRSWPFGPHESKHELLRAVARTP